MHNHDVHVCVCVCVCVSGSSVRLRSHLHHYQYRVFLPFTAESEQHYDVISSVYDEIDDAHYYPTCSSDSGIPHSNGVCTSTNDVRHNQRRQPQVPDSGYHQPSCCLKDVNGPSHDKTPLDDAGYEKPMCTCRNNAPDNLRLPNGHRQQGWITQ